MPAPSASAQTRHGLYGGPRPLYGSFAGKSDAAVVSGEQIRDGIPTNPYIRDGIAATTVRDGVPTNPYIRDGVTV